MPLLLIFSVASRLNLWTFYQLFSSVQSLSPVQLFMTPWPAAHQASLSFTNSRSLLKQCPSSRWCHPTISSSVGPLSSHIQPFPASGSFQMSQFFPSSGQSIGVSTSTSVLAMNIQDWFPLGWTDRISLQSRGTFKSLQHHSSKVSILWCSAFFIIQLSHPYMTTGKSIALNRWTFVSKVMYLLLIWCLCWS